MMGRVTPALVMVSLIACGSSGVVELEMVPPAGTSEVELFIGIREEHVEGLRPDGYGTLLPSVWWKRDRDPERDIQKISASGTLTFAFEPGGDEDKLRAFVAVAFDEQGQAVGVGAQLTPTPIPLESEIHRYVIPFAMPAALPNRTAAPPTGPGLQLWGPMADPRACVHVNNVTGTSVYDPMVTDAMISTGGNADCDEVDDDDPLECVPREFMGQRPMSRTALTCARDRPITADGATACVVGGGTCVDGLGPDPDGCHPSSYCAPASVCATCGGGLLCDTLLTNPASLTYIYCQLPSAQQGSGREELCSPATPLPVQDASAGITCGGVAKLGDKVNPFAVSLPLGTATTISVEAVDLASCKFQLIPAGPVPLGGSGGGYTRDFAATFTVPLTSPVKGRGLALPVHFDVVNNGCATSGYCQVRHSSVPDTIQACISTPILPGTVPID